jgi:hypothetical protein
MDSGFDRFTSGNERLPQKLSSENSLGIKIWLDTLKQVFANANYLQEREQRGLFFVGHLIPCLIIEENLIKDEPSRLMRKVES